MANTLSTDEILRRWTAGLADGAELFYADGRRVCAVGTSLVATWEGPRTFNGRLAQWLPAGRHGRTAPILLATADEWGSPPFQTSLQWQIRTAASRAASELGAEPLLVPFSALAAAGIIPETIRILERRPDANWTETRTAAEWAHVPIRERFSTAWDERTSNRFEDVPSGETWRYRKYDYKSGGYSEPVPDEDGLFRWKVSRQVRLRPDEDGLYRWEVHRHRMGDSVFTATVLERRTVSTVREWTVSEVVAAAVRAVENEREGMRTAHRRLVQTYSRAYRGSDEWKRNPYLRTVDETETAASRLESLELEPITETSSVDVRRRRRFVSSFDMNEPRPAYFLATLPSSSRAVTVEMAIQDLAPAAVHAAMARGKEVLRQGDIFYIPTAAVDGALPVADEDVRSRARLTQWTRFAAPKPWEVGYVAPPGPSTVRRMRRFTRERFRLELERALAVTAGHTRTGLPVTAPNGRRQWKRLRLQRAADIATARRRARAAVLNGNGYGARSARETYMRLESAPIVDGRGNPSRAVSRDSYRRGYGTNAVAALQRARAAAEDHFTRGDMSAAADWTARRERLRTALSVHGTAHTATEVLKASGGRTYVRGIVRHEPAIARENRDRDHIPVRLERGRWYLAVRNTVPRNRDGRP